MSLASYADLQTQIANWIARDDLTAYIPDFITLFECAAARKLKVRPQQTVVTLPTTNGIGTLPSDYLGYDRVTWNGSPNQNLDYVAPSLWAAEWIPNTDGTAIKGIPSIFTIEGSSIKIKPVDDTGLVFGYFQKTPAVSGSLNWLYTNHPDAYLFGTLCEANAFNKGKAFQDAALWMQRRDQIFQEIFALDFNERRGMQVRVFGYTP